MRNAQICFDVVPDKFGVPLAVDPVYIRGSYGCFLHRKFSGSCWWKPRSQRQWSPELMRHAAIRRLAGDWDITYYDDVRDFAALDLAGTPLSTSKLLSEAFNGLNSVSEMSLREFMLHINNDLPAGEDSQGTYVCQCGFYLGWDRLSNCCCGEEQEPSSNEEPVLWSGYAYDDLDLGFQRPFNLHSDFGHHLDSRGRASVEAVLDAAFDSVNEHIVSWGADRGLWHPYQEQGLARSFALFDVTLTRIHFMIEDNKVFQEMLSAMRLSD